MANDVAAIALTYDGTDIQAADLSIHLEIVEGLHDSPEVRGEDVVVPYLDGRVARPRRFDRRRPVLRGWVQGVGDTLALARSDFRTSMKTLNVLFDNTREPAILRAVLEDGDIARIYARPLNILVSEVIPSLVAEVSIELEAVSDWEGLGS